MDLLLKDLLEVQRHLVREDVRELAEPDAQVLREADDDLSLSAVKRESKECKCNVSGTLCPKKDTKTWTHGSHVRSGLKTN